jgi:hypothetical protein
MSQSLCVPCKHHGDIHVALQLSKKFSLTVHTAGTHILYYFCIFITMTLYSRRGIIRARGIIDLERAVLLDVRARGIITAANFRRY